MTSHHQLKQSEMQKPEFIRGLWLLAYQCISGQKIRRAI